MDSSQSKSRESLKIMVLKFKDGKEVSLTPQEDIEHKNDTDIWQPESKNQQLEIVLI